MNDNIAQLQQERKQIYNDFYNNILPKRLPVAFSMQGHMIAEYGGENTVDFQFDFSKLENPARKICDSIYLDVCPVKPMGIISRPPKFYQFIDSQSFLMGTNGFVQHPEVTGMGEDEYAGLIRDPYAFLLEKVIPRQYKALDPTDPVNMMIAMQRAKSDINSESQSSIPLIMKLNEEYGFYPGAPMGSGGFTAAPYDFIADQLRGFSGISMDIRRHRSELKEACEAILPLIFNFGLPVNPHPEGSVACPLHMPTFMREKDFAEIWLPTFRAMMEQYASKGVRLAAFCEDDWMRYLDYLLELPAGTHLMFEYGDPQIIKDKLGKKFIISGLYPINLIKTGTKQQCIDKAKELLDIMMPGGGYMFNFDKPPLMLGDVNMENYISVAEFIRDYAVYPNAGKSFGTPLNSEDFKFDEKSMTLPKSKYLFDWEQYKIKYPLTPDFAKADLEQIDRDIFKFNINLLV